MAKILQIPAVETLRRIQRIQVITIVWMSIEAAVSLSAGWIARSPALLAFGGDSAIELLSRARKPCATRAGILPRSHPRRSMIGAYGDTGRPHPQTWQPQLGASHAVRSRSPY